MFKKICIIHIIYYTLLINFRVITLKGRIFLRTKKRKIIFFAITFFCIIGIVVIFSLLEFSNKQNQFPIWEKSIDKETSSDVQIGFIGIDAYTSSGDTIEDEIVVSLENTSSKQFSYGADYWVDYLFEEQWYTVYRPKSVKLYSVILDPYEKLELYYKIPHGLLKNSGLYRLYLDDLGYCLIDIIIDVK